MRWKAHRDRNQGEIVAALEAAGCAVHDTAAAGRGFPDLVVSFITPRDTRTILVEVKRPTPGRRHGEDKPSQQRFRNRWKDTVHRVLTPAEAVAIVERYRRDRHG